VRFAARAPGKLVLLGEYAVLDGAPALVMAVARYVRASIGPANRARSVLTMRAGSTESVVAAAGQPTGAALIESGVDKISFTGSVATGRKVGEACGRNLIPVTLELGGKSPCIVDDDADIDVAAQRIAWGKYINAGQVCIAPDYVLVKREREEELVAALAEFDTFWHEDPIRMDGLESLKAYARTSPAPVCASEMLATRYAFRDLLETGAAGYAMLDICCAPADEEFT